MSFEQLAELRQQLIKQKAAKQQTSTKPQHKSRPVNPLLESIRRLQQQFPLAFPKTPLPKRPLKLGIIEDIALQLDTLGLTRKQLEEALATWCRGKRYWDCMVENTARVDLQGADSGLVTADQATHAQQRQAFRQSRAQARTDQDKQSVIQNKLHIAPSTQSE
ncbi:MULTISPECIES: ProQ/FinO family protein [unclassified Serratia (in: enterobacteria)]|uniref:ProQ/FinO family protein n=1 Tax=unclassified Serratia (in: enterobacteria) TaxID=2647522 RepID=UPI0030767A2C